MVGVVGGMPRDPDITRNILLANQSARTGSDPYPGRDRVVLISQALAEGLTLVTANPQLEGYGVGLMNART